MIVSILTDAKAFFDYDQRELGNTLNVDDDNVQEPEPEPPTQSTSTFGASSKLMGYNEV